MLTSNEENAFETVKIERDDENIIIVTLNRPHKLNAFTKPMWERMRDVFRELANDKTARCVVLRGSGEEAFSPGNDISEFRTDRSNSKQAKAYGKLMHQTIEALRALQHPTVAMIHGICVGGGLEVAGLCNIRICGESSRFGVPIAKLGLVMAYPEISALKGLVGQSKALELLLEGRIIGASEAEKIGIASRVVPDDQVKDEAMKTARRVASGAPLVHQWHKKFLERLNNPEPLSDAELDEGFQCYDTDDYRLGYQAFIDKSKPKFTGK